MRDIQKAIPKDSKVIVSCQKGLRSLAAAEQMSRAGAIHSRQHFPSPFTVVMFQW